MEQWKITKDRTKCTRPGCPLAVAAEYFAVLELPSCTRRDVCEPCFREIERGSQDPVLFWRGKRKRTASRGPVLDLDSLRVLFDSLGRQTDPDKLETARGLRYLVALLLLRKRKLRMVDAATPEQEAADLVVIDPKVEGMEPVALVAPELDEERLASLKDDLLAALEDVEPAGTEPPGRGGS